MFYTTVNISDVYKRIEKFKEATTYLEVFLNHLYCYYLF